jgi:hypothetical protein
MPYDDMHHGGPPARVPPRRPRPPRLPYRTAMLFLALAAVLVGIGLGALGSH